MKVSCLLVLALGACSHTENSFVVADDQQRVQSATLSLCGAESPLQRVRNTLEATVPITCEGEGQITLAYRDGATMICHVGYVTPGAEQHFRFNAEQSSCSPVS